MKMTTEQIRQSGFVPDGNGGFSKPSRWRAPASDPSAPTNVFRPDPPQQPIQTNFVERPPCPESELNKTETKFLEERLKRDGTVRWIGIQSVTLTLAHRCRYTPDFVSIDDAGRMTFWEVKGGHIWEDSTIKTKTAARMFRWARFIRSQWKESKWIDTEFRP